MSATLSYFLEPNTDLCATSFLSFSYNFVWKFPTVDHLFLYFHCLLSAVCLVSTLLSSLASLMLSKMVRCAWKQIHFQPLVYFLLIVGGHLEILFHYPHILGGRRTCPAPPTSTQVLHATRQSIYLGVPGATDGTAGPLLKPFYNNEKSGQHWKLVAPYSALFLEAFYKWQLQLIGRYPKSDKIQVFFATNSSHTQLHHQ